KLNHRTVRSSSSTKSNAVVSTEEIGVLLRDDGDDHDEDSDSSTTSSSTSSENGDSETTTTDISENEPTGKEPEQKQRHATSREKFDMTPPYSRTTLAKHRSRGAPKKKQQTFEDLFTQFASKIYHHKTDKLNLPNRQASSSSSFSSSSSHTPVA